MQEQKIGFACKLKHIKQGVPVFYQKNEPHSQEHEQATLTKQEITNYNL